MYINGVKYTKEMLAQMIDQTLLGSDTTASNVSEVCRLAKEYCFKSVSVNPYWGALVAKELAGTGIETNLAIGFPLGSTPTACKLYEAKEGIRTLAGRPGSIDMVTNIGLLKDKDYRRYTADVAEVVKAGHDASIEVKAILETSMLNDGEIATACECTAEAGADFVKTSTGRFGGPLIKHVRIMRKAIPPGMGVKFSGFGLYNAAELAIMAIGAGANRLGTPIGPQIVTEIEKFYMDKELRG